MTLCCDDDTAEQLLLPHRFAVGCLTDEHSTIMVTWANFHYKDFVMNWVDHVRNVGVSAYLVGAMDDKLLEVGSVFCIRELTKHSPFFMLSPARCSLLVNRRLQQLGCMT